MMRKYFFLIKQDNQKTLSNLYHLNPINNHLTTKRII